MFRSWSLFGFHNRIHTVGRIPWTGEISMPLVGFEPTTLAFVRTKTEYALSGADAVNGPLCTNVFQSARAFRSDSSGKSCAVVGQVHSWKLRGVVISHSFALSASRRVQFSFKSIENACTAFPSTLVSMLELSPPLPVLLLLRVGGLSRLNTRALFLPVSTVSILS
jgi:hypothetical protein